LICLPPVCCAFTEGSTQSIDIPACDSQYSSP